MTLDGMFHFKYSVFKLNFKFMYCVSCIVHAIMLYVCGEK